MSPAALTAFTALTAFACARIEPPPGGPEDSEPPRLIATVPDSMARVPGFNKDVEFRFDEVISEGGTPSQGTGTGDLEKLIILSPTTQVPDVSWRRTRITVRPDEGWRPDRVYRVQLLPGVTDLRRNRSDQGAVITFTTGAPVPQTSLKGTVVDWSSGRAAPNALVVALLLPDSLPYLDQADSSGRFNLGPIPAGEYLVSGVLDENSNHRADPREAFDSVRLARGRTDAGELWTFVHDTTPPRGRAATVRDSVAVEVELTQPLDPAQRLAAQAVRVLVLPDSTPVKVVSVLSKPLDDSLHAPAPRDTTAADTAAKRVPADTTLRPPRRPAVPRAAPPRRGRQPAAEKMSGRPPLSDRLVVRVGQPWRPGGRYAVLIRGVRNVTGVAGEVSATLAVPEAAKADSAAVADSLKRGPDSLRRAPDSLKRAPPKRR